MGKPYMERVGVEGTKSEETNSQKNPEELCTVFPFFPMIKVKILVDFISYYPFLAKSILELEEHAVAKLI